MRDSYALFWLGLWLMLTGCHSDMTDQSLPSDTNTVAIIGAIHGGHKSNESYSLEILRQAIARYDPDIVMVELPPDRFEVASDNYFKFGEVREDRADDFPELTDVVFPLRAELDFTIIPVAAWTKAIADQRRTTLEKLEDDPSRTIDWATYQAAIVRFNRAISGKSANPLFIHSGAYDAAVKARQETYQKLFGRDLEAASWAETNKSHLALINQALDDLTGQDKRILILFGAWHKYKILDDLEARSDIQIYDAALLF